jgi:hypothetical protein
MDAKMGAYARAAIPLVARVFSERRYHGELLGEATLTGP